MAAKAFASQADLAEKRESFVKLAENAYCLTAEGDPNTGVIIGDDGVMVIDTRATPVMAEDVIRHVRGVTDKRIKYVLLTHYHAVRVMGASAYKADYVIASRGTYELIKERGRQDFESEVQRFPRLFRAVESVPGLTWPNLVFDAELTLWLGKTEVQLKHIGKGHSKGDTIAWLPKERVLFSGDLVEEGTTPYCGDAYLKEWPATLEKLRAFKAEKLVPGRGDAMMTAEAADKAIAATAAFLRDMRRHVERGVAAGNGLKVVFEETKKALEPKYGKWVIFEHCLPFNVSRCFDETSGVVDPRIWTAERDMEMWKTLEG
ncbi:MAG TPA: MBL fold metallo-hydrolase [Alphaproteobacteria bacterium]|nr:MBL fold metallo-hydrolase [Alphaproteobacteria bacterium]